MGPCLAIISTILLHESRVAGRRERRIRRHRRDSHLTRVCRSAIRFNFRRDYRLRRGHRCGCRTARRYRSHGSCDLDVRPRRFCCRASHKLVRRSRILLFVLYWFCKMSEIPVESIPASNTRRRAADRRAWTESSSSKDSKRFDATVVRREEWESRIMSASTTATRTPLATQTFLPPPTPPSWSPKARTAVECCAFGSGARCTAATNESAYCSIGYSRGLSSSVIEVPRRSVRCPIRRDDCCLGSPRLPRAFTVWSRKSQICGPTVVSTCGPTVLYSRRQNSPEPPQDAAGKRSFRLDEIGRTAACAVCKSCK